MVKHSWTSAQIKMLLVVCVHGVFPSQDHQNLSSAQGLSALIALSLLTFLCFKSMCSWGAGLITMPAQGPELPPSAPAFEAVLWWPVC